MDQVRQLLSFMNTIPVALLAVACGGRVVIREGNDALVKIGSVFAFHDSTFTTPFTTRIDGVSLSAPPRPVGREVFDSIAAVHAEWVAIVPYAYGPGGDGRLFWQGTDWQWWGESLDGTRAQIRLARAAGLRVMLKPHLWLGHGEFTGTFVADAVGWEPFEASYRDYMLTYARLAEAEQVDMVCIGTELGSFTRERPQFWSALIDSVRSVYGGALTYAANWDEVTHVQFWPLLDLIGVDGYFPLTQKPTRSADSIAIGWSQHTRVLRELSDRYRRQVLFTEMGYCCTSTCTVEPWKEDRTANRDELAQASAYTAFFNTMQRQRWYAGCFVWKWFADGGRHEGRGGPGFSPQGNAAHHILRRAFKAP